PSPMPEVDPVTMAFCPVSMSVSGGSCVAFLYCSATRMPIRGSGSTIRAECAVAAAFAFVMSDLPDCARRDEGGRWPPATAGTILTPDQPFLDRPLDRRRTVGVMVGDVMVGGGAPVVVQSMTNTDTADVDATVAQVAALHR